MFYVITSAPVPPAILTAALDSGVGNPVPILNVAEDKAVVTFASAVDNYDMLTDEQLREYLATNSADWEKEV